METVSHSSEENMPLRFDPHEAFSLSHVVIAAFTEVDGAHVGLLSEQQRKAMKHQLFRETAAMSVDTLNDIHSFVKRRYLELIPKVSKGTSQETDAA